jgi:type II secretory pathway component PulJ
MKTQVGISFIEILVSLSLLAIMLLSLDAMQLYSLRETKSAYYVGIAEQQINNMAERLSVLKNHISQNEIKKWNDQNKKSLPDGQGDIISNGPHLVITVSWGQLITSRCEKTKMGLSGCLKKQIIIH